MRPIRFIILVACFIAIPILLTCISLFRSQNDNVDVFGRQPRSRLRALFSFSTPSALFPPTALISLATENSTFFLARPAAFGPSLPSKGLTGQLWIGRGFGDDSILSEEDLKISGFELGCSDVPNWGHDHKNTPDSPALKEKAVKRAEDGTPAQRASLIASDIDRANGVDSQGVPLPDSEDGTDDHLHRPLPDSNPAPVVKPGEPANVNKSGKSQKATHADIESLQESADIAGKIVMLSRGGCGFLEKVKWTQRRGGVALIVGDNERNGPLTIMYAKGDTSNITIPAVFTSYTSAHLLSTLVPPEDDPTPIKDGKKIPHKDKAIELKGDTAVKEDGPVFTSSVTSAAARSTKSAGNLAVPVRNGWMQNVLQAVGLDDASLHSEDSRRPPGSGNIEWVQVKDWDEDLVKTASTATSTPATSKSMTTSIKNAKLQTTAKPDNDDFVIGVQDWRDTELIAPKATATGTTSKGKAESTSTSTAISSHETQFKGGSIIPGSGEYQKLDKNEKHEQNHQPDSLNIDSQKGSSVVGKFKSWFASDEQGLSEADKTSKQKQPHTPHKGHDGGEHPGLWVTLTPASVSTSPFFDTLLVLVISPLVTLTVVYGMLLLRSRIRRRRWRAPKSVVDRLPVRVYHPVASTASTTSSSQVASPNQSQHASPQLRPEPVRVRQRSQTTIGVVNPGAASSASPPKEKPKTQQARRYKGRQIECVVCLEEYVDGESIVMSLPCGHEFHADCITPWLVNRRRTCPICKGDVVRSLQKAGSAEEDNREPGDETSDGVQERLVNTIPDDTSTASIPIPERPESLSLMDEDIERGEREEAQAAEPDARRPIAARWRGIVNSSLSSLSGDTLWRTNSVDRNR